MAGRMPFEDIPKLISSSDICLLPAYNNEIMSDIVPIKLYEYLAMHKPIISTELPGVVTEFGKNNGIIYVDKPEDVVETVIYLDNEVLEEERLKAGNFIKDYDWEKIIDKFELLLFDLSKEKQVE